MSNTTDTQQTTMSPRWRRLLLTAHLAVSVGLVGAALVLIALGVSSLRGADPEIVYPAAHLVDAWVVIPLAALALVTGVIQAISSGRGLLQYWWVTVKLVVTAVTFIAVAFLLEPRLAANANAARAGQVFTTAQRLPLAIAPSMAAALLLFNVTLGIYKPGRRRSAQMDSTTSADSPGHS